MTKTIHTLVKDIYAVIDGKGGWDKAVDEFFRESVGTTVRDRLNPKEYKSGGLRMSNLGTPCKRKLWYGVNASGAGIPLPSSTRFKFLFGDILEDFLIAAAIAAGHEVTGLQDELKVAGIKGHRDCVIDGVTVDIKSASTNSFKKFKNHNLRYDDPFGYIGQLSSYVYAAKDDPLVRDKANGAFLVVDKQHGHICLDMYDFTKEISTKEADVQSLKKLMKEEEPPARLHEPEPMGKSGNEGLTKPNCTYCDYKGRCHPGLRGFVYSKGSWTKVEYLTKVVKEPRVKEVDVL